MAFRLVKKIFCGKNEKNQSRVKPLQRGRAGEPKIGDLSCFLGLKHANDSLSVVRALYGLKMGVILSIYPQ